MASVRLRSALLGLAIAGVAVLALFAWRAQQRAEDAEANLPFETARVLAATLTKSAALRVSTLRGAVAVTAADPGFAGLLPSTQKQEMPYAVDYFIDLGRMGAAQYRWNAKARAMLVELPDVTMAVPNIDETRAQGGSPSGIYVTRDASDRLHQQLSARAVSVARAEAAKPENLEKARANARDAVAQLTRAPLAAAGLDRVSVIIRFPFERPGAIGERWDESTPLDVILGKKDAAR